MLGQLCQYHIEASVKKEYGYDDQKAERKDDEQ